MKLGIPTYTREHHVEFFARALRSESPFYYEGQLAECRSYTNIYPDKPKVRIRTRHGIKEIILSRDAQITWNNPKNVKQ